MTNSHNLDHLWGSTVTGLDCDVAARALRLHIVTIDHNEEHAYDLRLDGIWELHVAFTEAATSWDYVELTSIEVEPRPDGYFITMEFWSSNSKLEVYCRHLLIEEKDGTGVRK